MAPLTFLKSCLPWNSRTDTSSTTRQGEGVPPAQSATPARPCIFCNMPPMSDSSSPFKVVLESEELVAFHDRSPKGVVHLLTVPRRHIKDIHALQGPEGIDLVGKMVEFGNRALDLVEGRSHSRGGMIDSQPEDSSVTTSMQRLTPADVALGKRRFGFHIPPLTSVSHLHLHCFVEPLTRLGRIEFPVAPSKLTVKPPRLKGFSWFISAEQTRMIFEAGKKVTVGSVHA